MRPDGTKSIELIIAERSTARHQVITLTDDQKEIMSVIIDHFKKYYNIPTHDEHLSALQDAATKRAL